MEIRDFRPDDLGLVYEAYHHLSRDSQKDESTSRYIRYLTDLLYTKHSARGFVADEAGEAIGLIVVDFEIHSYETPECFVLCEMVYVKKKFKQQGVGQQLVNHAFNYCTKETKFPRIRVCLQPKNKGFNEFVKGLGFKEIMNVYEWSSNELSKVS